MEPKKYQTRTLEEIKSYLQRLFTCQQSAHENRRAESDFPAEAWTKMEGLNRPYIARRDGLGRYLPCFCLKIPTGGGKTFLAVKTIDLVNTNYLKKRTGLVLWVVPTTQIYNQTIKSLRDRDHPYRQHLDIASGGRTVIREKGEHFTPEDVSESLVVLMLMLPSANRKTKEHLRLFKDSGGFADFFPSEDDAQGTAKLLEKVPNLDTFESQNAFWGRQVKTSLGNTLRLLNPILILDEGHKAYSETAQQTLNGFNPSIIVELSATPPQGSNILVDVTGIELNREDMIKFDMHVINKASPDWKDTLLDSHKKLEELTIKAHDYEGQTGNHIRPICLIQVERTGAAQRGQGKIHSEDVREQLIKVIGVAAEEVAVKTSEKDELKEVDDIGGLMSKDCRIRYIITKHALQEGWDCAFAYVLSILTNPGSKTALTQLVGRILRQPYARKTGIKELDESYVYCYQQRGNELLNEIRQGFKGEGLGDLNGRVAVEDEAVGSHDQERVPQIREKFLAAAEQVILPVFVTREGANWRKVSYEMDIASRIPWDEADLTPMYDLTLSMMEEKDVEHTGGVSDDPSRAFDYKESVSLRTSVLRLDPVFVARHLLDVAPNPWVAHEFAQSMLARLLERNDKSLVANNFVFIVEKLHEHLLKERDRLSQIVFKDMLSNDMLRFLVIANDLGWKLAKKKRPTRPPWLPKGTGLALERSLFDPVPADDLNEMEKRVAWYLDDQHKLLFWYRNVPKQDYAVQGWRRGKVYADFIFTDTDETGTGFNRVFVVETKGLHLKDYEDTRYKKALFDTCNELARETTLTQLGLKLHAKEISFAVVHEDEWQRRFNELFACT
ncbi:MAG: restriction endonuclease subunit R [Planctomycetes bacterium RBG_13_60_9]|nr:MAG: restriction endonuclease subunit R [Planctomycetes bacterium RBG_13_60_9]